MPGYVAFNDRPAKSRAPFFVYAFAPDGAELVSEKYATLTDALLRVKAIRDTGAVAGAAHVGAFPSRLDGRRKRADWNVDEWYYEVSDAAPETRTDDPAYHHLPAERGIVRRGARIIGAFNMAHGVNFGRNRTDAVSAECGDVPIDAWTRTERVDGAIVYGRVYRDGRFPGAVVTYTIVVDAPAPAPETDADDRTCELCGADTFGAFHAPEDCRPHGAECLDCGAPSGNDPYCGPCADAPRLDVSDRLTDAERAELDADTARIESERRADARAAGFETYSELADADAETCADPDCTAPAGIYCVSSDPAPVRAYCGLGHYVNARRAGKCACGRVTPRPGARCGFLDCIAERRRTTYVAIVGAGRLPLVVHLTICGRSAGAELDNGDVITRAEAARHVRNWRRQAGRYQRERDTRGINASVKLTRVRWIAY